MQHCRILFIVLFLVHEGLTTEMAEARVVPGTAESSTVRDDGLVYTFIINRTYSRRLRVERNSDRPTTVLHRHTRQATDRRPT
jgi:hypothetical protein